jgi:hypothetical protein
MKINTLFSRFTIALGLCFALHVKGQTVNTEWATKINQTFANIDKDRIPHSLLRDYDMEFTDLSNYNGTLSDTNYVSRGSLKSIYNTLVMARVKPTVTSLVSPSVFRQNWNNLRQENTLVISGLYYKYSQLKSNAYPSFITVSKNKLYDKYVNGVWQNPYEVKQVFAMTTPITKFKGLTIDVQLPQSLWYTNQGSNVQNIAIDFDNGAGYINMSFGGNHQLQYIAEGIYDWTYKLTLTNGQILYSQSRMIFEETLYDVVSQPTIMKRTISEPCALNDAGLDQVEFVGTQNYLGQTNTATIEIDYLAGNDCSDGITKPLIVAEGFDSGLLGMENGLGDVDYGNFRFEYLNATGTLGVTISDYDIIYINWDEGRDHLQRNALLLEDIIQWVNAEKANNGSTEQNVVLGQSMGGVLARYALADMEQRNITHDTKLYISHDAPHQGANIPIGIQYFARHLADQFIGTPLGDFSFEVSDDSEASIQEINALFNEPGTQQLLSNYITPSFGLNNSAHEAWQTDLQSKGYPTLTRNIAISNGSHCANTQEYDYNASLFRMNGNARTGVLTDLLGSFLGIADDIALAVIFDEPALLLGVLPGSSKFDLDFNAKALPRANNSANIYKGKVSYTKKLFWFINITVNLTNRSYNNPVNLSYDKYAGGRYELFRGIDPIDYFDDDNVLIGDDPITQFQADLLNALVGSANINFDVEQTFGFIPTPSALDVGNGNTDLDDDDYFRVYNAANPPSGDLAIPFDNFITAYENNNSLNEQHISFNFRNGDWLATELDTAVGNEDIFDCSFVCGEESVIIGVSQFCTGSRTFSVPAGADTYQWQFFSDPIPMNDTPLNGNVTVISATDTNMLAINHTGNRSGWYNLRVVINSNRCDVQNLVLTKRVYIGAPTVDSISVVSDSEAGAHLSPGINNCEVALGLNFNPNNNDITDIEWEKITTDVAWSRDYVDYDDRYVYLFPECNKEFKFRVRAKNSCGFWSPWRELTYDITECSTTCQTPTGNIVSDNFILYPVPANTILNFGVQPNNTWNFPSSSPFVNLNDLNTDPTIDGSGNITYPRVRLLISFYNSMGNLIYSTTIQGLPNQMDVSSLPTGNYIMTIEYLGQIETHNIQIN